MPNHDVWQYPQKLYNDNIYPFVKNEPVRLIWQIIGNNILNHSELENTYGYKQAYNGGSVLFVTSHSYAYVIAETASVQ